MSGAMAPGARLAYWRVPNDPVDLVGRESLRRPNKIGVSKLRIGRHVRSAVAEWALGVVVTLALTFYVLPAKAALQDVVTVTFGGHHVTFSLRGALPVDWRVTVGQEKGQEHALPEVLFEPSASADSTGRFFGIDLPGRKEKGLANPDNVRYRFRKIANQGSVELRFSAPAAEDGLAVVKSFFLYEDHFRARYVLELSNRGTASLTLGNNEAGPGIALASTLGDKVSAALWRGRPVNISDDGIEGLDLDEDTPASVLQPVPVGWSGIESRYLLLALQPQQGTDSFDRIEAAIAGPRNEQVDFDAQPISTILRLPSATLAVGSSRRFEFAVYAGPKSKSAFADDAVLGQSLFGDLWNWMRWLCLALAWLLDLVHAAIPSWGLSLVALALLMRVILLPVTVKAQVHQSRTMIDQARLKPMLARIESEHAEDLEARNAATQKLYADEGLSMLAPLTGCLWVFLQIPIFMVRQKNLWASCALFRYWRIL